MRSRRPAGVGLPRFDSPCARRTTKPPRFCVTRVTPLRPLDLRVTVERPGPERLAQLITAVQVMCDRGRSEMRSELIVISQLSRVLLNLTVVKPNTRAPNQRAISTVRSLLPASCSAVHREHRTPFGSDDSIRLRRLSGHEPPSALLDVEIRNTERREMATLTPLHTYLRQSKPFSFDARCCISREHLVKPEFDINLHHNIRFHNRLSAEPAHGHFGFVRHAACSSEGPKPGKTRCRCEAGGMIPPPDQARVDA
jgi:hypothetical protein